jgi:hypothetical protein
MATRSHRQLPCAAANENTRAVAGMAMIMAGAATWAGLIASVVLGGCWAAQMLATLPLTH